MSLDVFLVTGCLEQFTWHKFVIQNHTFFNALFVEATTASIAYVMTHALVYDTSKPTASIRFEQSFSPRKGRKSKPLGH